MKVLITGASGFVGRATCTRLRAQGMEVVGAVRQLPAQALPGVDYCIVGDLSADTDWRASLAGVEGIIHCAARVHVMRETAEDPLAAFRSTNVAGTERLARQAVAAGVKRLVFISSIKVNGEETAPVLPLPLPNPLPRGERELAISLPRGTRGSFREDDTPAPQDPYGQTKWEAEAMLAQVAQETGLEVVIVRPPLVYGPGVKGNLARLLGWIGRGIPLPLAGIRNGANR